MYYVTYFGHIGYQKKIAVVRGQYFWPRMKKDIVDYTAKHMQLQRVKVKHRYPTGLLQPLPIPKKKWKVETIDFITKLPRTTRQHDSIMVVVDKLTKASHFLPMKTTHTTTNIAEIYMREIPRLHEILKVIVEHIETQSLLQISGWNYLKDLVPI